MKSNNVITFPKKNNNLSKTKTVEEINQNLEMMNHYHIQETISNIAPMIFNQLEISGFSVSDEEPLGIKYGAFIIESLRSIMCSHYDLYHPFQRIADSVFIDNLEEHGTLKIVEKLDLDLKPDDDDITETENEVEGE